MSRACYSDCGYGMRGCLPGDDPSHVECRGHANEPSREPILLCPRWHGDQPFLRSCFRSLSVWMGGCREGGIRDSLPQCSCGILPECRERFLGEYHRASVLIWGTQITLTQGFGYAIALGGLIAYSVGRDKLSKKWTTTKEWASDTWQTHAASRGKLALPTCRSIVIGLLGLMTIVMYGSVWYLPTPAGGNVIEKLESNNDDILRLLDLS